MGDVIPLSGSVRWPIRAVILTPSGQTLSEMRLTDARHENLAILVQLAADTDGYVLAFDTDHSGHLVFDSRTMRLEWPGRTDPIQAQATYLRTHSGGGRNGTTDEDAS